MTRGFIAILDRVRTGDGRPLPPKLKQEIVREHARLMLVYQQLKELEATSMAEVKAAAPGSAEAKIKQLIELKGLGRSARRASSTRCFTARSPIAARSAPVSA